MIIRTSDATYVWREPEASRANRAIPRGSKGHHVGEHVIGDGPGRRVGFESLLEEHTSTLMAHHSEVVDIEEQVGPVRYQDRARKTCKHYFDFRVTLVDGTRTLVCVKPDAVARKPAFKDLVRRLRVVAVPRVGNRIVVVTERNHDPVDLHNAELFQGCRDADEEADVAMAALAARLEGPCRLDQLAQEAGLGGRSFRAAVRLLRRGFLETLRPERITPPTVVRRRIPR